MPLERVALFLVFLAGLDGVNDARLEPRVGVALRGRLAGKRRMRVGGYRIVYKIRENGNLVIVEAIRPRSRAYRA